MLKHDILHFVICYIPCHWTWTEQLLSMYPHLLSILLPTAVQCFACLCWYITVNATTCFKNIVHAYKTKLPHTINHTSRVTCNMGGMHRQRNYAISQCTVVLTYELCWYNLQYTIGTVCTVDAQRSRRPYCQRLRLFSIFLYWLGVLIIHVIYVCLTQSCPCLGFNLTAAPDKLH